MPRPSTTHIEQVLHDIEGQMQTEAAVPQSVVNLDQRILHAAVEDARTLLQGVLCELGTRFATGPVHDYRQRNMLTCCGWVRVMRAYTTRPESCAERFALDSALALEYSTTPAAREYAVRCAALCSSFAEGREMLAHLTAVDTSTSTLRAIALLHGAKLLEEQSAPQRNIRPQEIIGTEGDKRHVTKTERTMYIMMDGTGVPCVKADTQCVKGKLADGSASTREIKVGVIGFFSWLDPKNRPVPEKGATTHVVSAESAPIFGSLLRENANSRGYGTAERVQVVGDGADWIAAIARIAFHDAIFTVDYFHACEHLHALCCQLQLSPESTQRTYRKFRGYLLRNGADSVIRNFNKHFADVIEQSESASKEIDYFRKRKKAMRYGYFRKQGLYIGSGHVEAACRTDVARRCKQAGMHWRHRNAEKICAIHAAIRSARFSTCILYHPRN